jgi:hypothetical protein
MLSRVILSHFFNPYYTAWGIGWYRERHEAGIVEVILSQVVWCGGSIKVEYQATAKIFFPP